MTANSMFGFPEGQTARSHLENLTRGLTQEQKIKVAREVAHVNEKGMRLLNEVFLWAADNGAFILDSNDCSRLHHLKEAARSGKLIGNDGPFETPNALGVGDHPEHTFVVRHDWARAFENADGLSNSIKLPYDMCAFEFRVGGRNLIAIAYDDGTPHFTAFIQCEEYWASFGNEKDIETNVVRRMWEQIRAICIALDAEVATHHHDVGLILADGTTTHCEMEVER